VNHLQDLRFEAGPIIEKQTLKTEIQSEK
jgi:hypothetical protein